LSVPVQVITVSEMTYNVSPYSLTQSLI